MATGRSSVVFRGRARMFSKKNQKKLSIDVTNLIPRTEPLGQAFYCFTGRHEYMTCHTRPGETRADCKSFKTNSSSRVLTTLQECVLHSYKSDLLLQDEFCQ